MTGSPVARFLWLLPAAASILLFWPGIQCWFQQDDFAWLALGQGVQSTGDLLRALFQPMAQGTIRPLSERAFFMSYFALFGLDALPFRLTVFLTFLVDLWLVYRLGLRLTASAAAATLAALLWGVNSSLGVPLAWTSSYNQILCAATLLGALYLFTRFADTGRKRCLAGCWIVFLLGFGVLELNVVFPALAAAFALLYAPRILRHTIPMFAVSGLYAVLHRMAAPRVRTGPYAMHLDPLSVLQTLQAYWIRAFGAFEIELLPVAPFFHSLGPWVLAAGTAALALFLLGRLWQRDPRVLFGLAWFLVVLGPVLPLRDHLSLYYLSIPTIGLAWLAAAATRAAFQRHVVLGLAASLLLAGYIATSGLVARSVVNYHRARSRQVRNLVLGVEQARQLHPRKTILLNGITSDLYWAGVNDNPFRLLNLRDVFLAPGSEAQIDPHPELGDPTEYILPAPQTLEALRNRTAVVYSFQHDRLHNITRIYTAIAPASLEAGLSRRVLTGSSRFSSQLGEGWYEPEGHFRWMARRAVVYLGGPDRPGQALRIEGFCPGSQIAAGPVRLAVRTNGLVLPVLLLDQPNERFSHDLPLPASLLNQPRLTVELELDRVTNPDGRPLGMPISSLSVR